MNKFNIILLFFCLTFLFLGCNEKKDNFSFFYDTPDDDKNFLKDVISEYQNNEKIKIDCNIIPFLELKPLIKSSKKDKIDLILGVSDWCGEFYKDEIIGDIDSDLFSKREFLEFEYNKVGIIRSYEFPVFFYYPDELNDETFELNNIFEKFGQEFLYDAKNMYFHIFISQFFKSNIFRGEEYNFQDKNFKVSLDFVTNSIKGKLDPSLTYESIVDLFVSRKIKIILDGIWNYERHMKNGAKVLPLFPEKIFFAAKVFYINNDLNDKDGLYRLIRYIKDKDITRKHYFDPESIPVEFQPIPVYKNMNNFWEEGNKLLENILLDEKVKIQN